MTEAQLDLARRAVACKGWRWMPGMLTLDDERMSDEGWPLYDTSDYGSSGVAECVEWHSNPSLDALPDLTDPATLGCLLALVREAWTISCICTLRYAGRWFIDLPSGEVVCCQTEIESLVAALEAAP